jgi:hypothetical protein
MKNEDGRLMVFGTALALGYLVFGALEVLGGVGQKGEWLESLYVQGSLMDGFVLLVIGAVLAFAWTEKEGRSAFVLVGMALGIMFLAIYLILMGADLLSLLIFGTEHVEGWTLEDGLRPGIYLGLMAAAGGVAWRKRLSLTRLSRAGA